MSVEKKWAAVLGGLFFPPKCAACGEFLREHLMDTEPRALCESCRRKWEYAKLTLCKKCGEELSNCRCVPQVLKRAGASAVLKMVSYDKNRDSVARRAVLFMKRRNNAVVFTFFSGQLASLLKHYLDETYTDAKGVLVTYVPRSRKNLLLSGVDQSELLAKGVASELGCDFAGLIGRRRRSDKEQKRMGEKARFAHAANAFCLKNADFKAINKRCRCLVLVDDVVTTGASLSACVRLLGECFGGRIVCVSLAQTEKE